jgi:hypothetical protein
MESEMTKKEAIKDSLEHWKRMQEYAKKKPPEERYDINLMDYESGEGPFTSQCSLCSLYFIRDFSEGRCIERCIGCPLKKESWCLDDDSIYNQVIDSSTWEEFVINSGKMIKVLQKLYEKCK